MNLEIMYSTFKDCRINQIVAFYSSFNLNFEELKKLNSGQLKALFRRTEYFYNSIPIFGSFNKNIYDLDFVENNKCRALHLKSYIDPTELIMYICHRRDFINFLCENSELSDKIENFKKILFFCERKITIDLDLDKQGIYIVHFDFKLKKEIQTNDLTDLVDLTCQLSDEILFKIIENDLNKNFFKNVDNKLLLNDKNKENFSLVHETYTVTVSTNFDTYCDNDYMKEIVGIGWKQPDFADLNGITLQKIMKNNISFYKNDILLITSVGTIMAIKGTSLKGDYINGRMNAIAMFCRQNLLLKKIHMSIDDLINNSLIDSNNPEDSINEIQKIQINIQSDLVFYENVILSIVDSYKLLFETFNNVLETDNKYKLIKSKIESSKSIYGNVIDNRRHKQMRDLQIIVLLVGILTIVITSAFSNWVDIYKNWDYFIDFLNVNSQIIIIILFIIISLIVVYFKSKKK